MTEKLNGIDEILNSLILNVKAKKGQFNKFGNYKYRSGEDILEAVKEELQKEQYPKNVILVSNPSLEEFAGRLFVKVITKISVGKEFIEASGYAEHGQNKKGMDEAQLTGSTCTYAKKYSLQNLFQLDESEDDIDAKDNTKVLAKAASDDMRETQQKANEELFAGLKAMFESCGGNEELDELWKSEKADISKLKKYAPNLYDMLGGTIKSMKESFNK